MVLHITSETLIDSQHNVSQKCDSFPIFLWPVSLWVKTYFEGVSVYVRCFDSIFKNHMSKRKSIKTRMFWTCFLNGQHCLFWPNPLRFWWVKLQFGVCYLCSFSKNINPLRLRGRKSHFRFDSGPTNHGSHNNASSTLF